MNDTSSDQNINSALDAYTGDILDLFQGLQPAYQNVRTGESHLSQTAVGVPANFYDFIGLPSDWIAERDHSGRAIALKPEVIAGYWFNGRFVSLSQIPNMPHDS